MLSLIRIQVNYSVSVFFMCLYQIIAFFFLFDYTFAAFNSAQFKAKILLQIWNVSVTIFFLELKHFMISINWFWYDDIL